MLDRTHLASVKLFTMKSNDYRRSTNIPYPPAPFNATANEIRIPYHEIGGQIHDVNCFFLWVND